MGTKSAIVQRGQLRARLRLANQDDMRTAFEDFLENRGLSAARVAKEASLSASTLTRWLNRETKARQTTLLRLIDRFPELLDDFGLTDSQNNFMEIPLIGICRRVDIQPIQPADSRRSIRLPRTVDDSCLDGWAGILIAADAYPQWQRTVAIIDARIMIEAVDGFGQNQPYLVVEKGTEKMYIGWVSVEDSALTLTDGFANVLKTAVVPERGHPIIAYHFYQE